MNVPRKLFLIHRSSALATLIIKLL